MTNSTILVIDDESQIRKFLKISLESHGYLYCEAESGTQGLNLAVSQKPDLIILDLGLPDQDGHEVLVKLREWFQKPIVILSVRNDDEDIVRALDQGANDYIRKPFSNAELLARVRLCLKNRSEGESSPILKFGRLTVDLSKHNIFLGEQILKLTATEYELLRLFVTNAGKVLTHSFILKTIWGPNAEKHTHYLRVYMSHLRQKIDDEALGKKFFITEPGVGYRFVVH